MFLSVSLIIQVLAEFWLWNHLEIILIESNSFFSVKQPSSLVPHLIVGSCGFPRIPSDFHHDIHIHHHSWWTGCRHSGHSSGRNLHPAPKSLCHSAAPSQNHEGPAHHPRQDGWHDGCLPARGAAGPWGETNWSDIWPGFLRKTR